MLERCYRGGNSGPHTVWTDVDDNDDPGESADGVASTDNGVCAWNRCEREVMFVCWCSTIITGALGEPIKTLVRAVATSRHAKEKTIVCNLETSKGTTVGNLNNLETLDIKYSFSLTLTITCIG